MQPVAADRHRLPGLQVLNAGRAVGAAGDPDREQHDRGVDDVAAVAAPVAADERVEGAEPGPLAERLARSRAAHELFDDRREHEDGERVCDEPGDVRAGAEHDQHDARDERRDRRPDQALPDRA